MNEINSMAWTGIDVFPDKAKKLDSSIKRNTGFIKKLKQGITKESKTGLLNDIREVSLEKYLSEIITTTNEALFKNSGKGDDIVAVVEIVSGLHQRFNMDFTLPLIESFLFIFETSSDEAETEKDKTTRTNVLKACTRVLIELHLTGVLPSLDDLNKSKLPPFVVKRYSKKEPIVFIVLREVLNYKFKEALTTPVAILILKKYPELLSEEVSDMDNLINSEELKTLLRSLFKIYKDIVFQQTVELNKKTIKLMKEHHKAQIRTGKESSEYLDDFNELNPIFEKFSTVATALAEAFNMDPPELLDIEQSLKEQEPSIITPASDWKEKQEPIWENEENRRFYENLADLSAAYATYDPEKTPSPEDVIALFADFETVETKDEIDEISRRYWLQNLDNKATRKRLMKFFVECKDWSKISLYARFMANNENYLSEVKEELIQYLDSGFRSQLHSNKINIKNIIFFAEMVKFMLIPSFMIFHKIRTLAMNITVPNNIEILSTLFESFGKFLINTPEFKPQMEKMMVLIKEKKKDHLLTVNNKAALDNLIILIYPPQLNVLNQEKRDLSPEQLFFITLIRRELDNVSLNSALKLILKASWNDPNVEKTLLSLFSKPEKVSYQSLPKLANILTYLFKHYKSFTIKTVDTLLEKIQVGLESGEYSLNMARVSQVKYLTELYNTSFLKFEVLLDTMYRILRFGYPSGQPNPFFINEGDLPDNYFRISLISTILLGINRKSEFALKKLKIFIQFFEYYIFCKDQPLPNEVSFKVENVFALYPDHSRSSDWSQCYEKLILLLKELGVTSAEAMTSTGRGENEDVDDDDEDDDDDDENDDEDEDEEEVDTAHGTIRVLDNIEIDLGLNEAQLELSDISSLSDGSATDDSSDSDNGDEQDMNDSLESSAEEVSDDDEDEENDDEDDEEDEDDEDDQDDEDDEDDEEEDEEEDNDDDDDDYLIDREKEKKRIMEEFEKKLADDSERKAQADFDRQFQLMMDESLGSIKNETVQSVSMPMHFSSQAPKSDIPSETPKGGKIPFMFLSRSGKKTQAHSINVPSETKFVSEILEEEQRVKEERQKIKSIVMNRNFD